jgi:hypothetical protein
VINSYFSRHLDKMGVVGQAGSFAPWQDGAFVRDDALRDCRGRRGIQRAQQKCSPRLLHLSPMPLNAALQLIERRLSYAAELERFEAEGRGCLGSA